MNRSQLLDHLCDILIAEPCTHTLRVAVDGIDAAGKTTLSGEMAKRLHTRQKPVIQASIDGFHNTREIRYRRGSLSPEGYFLDSFDLSTLIDVLLTPLGEMGDGLYQQTNFNFRTNRKVESPFQQAQPGTILLFDGVFLLRPELDEYWDFAIYVDVTFDTSLARGTARDQDLFGSESAARQRFLQRYLPGQRLYLDRYNPREKANLIIDNNLPEQPVVLEINHVLR